MSAWNIVALDIIALLALTFVAWAAERPTSSRRNKGRHRHE